jgi:outer membrane protein OmpA-like peptidoglycan-associated protein
VSGGVAAGANGTGSGVDTWSSNGANPDEGDKPAEADDELSSNWRRSSLQLHSSISGSTGGLHVSQAGSGAPGTFRFSLLTSFFSGSGVLCDSGHPCPSLHRELATDADDLSAMTAHLGLSATILPFLEGYVGFHNRASSDTRGRPQLLQVLGDTNIGVKGFMPAAPDQLFFFGGEAEMWLLNGTGKVGLNGGGTSFVFRGLATLDANNRLNPEDRIPIRAHLNLGYKFDNSSNLVEDLENNPPPNGRGERISRIERFGLGINRVDFFQFALGAEYVHPVIRPFLEWSLDAPINRKGYICNIDQAEARGDSCLKLKQGLGIAPSRLTLGARLFPWEGRGLGLLAAFDIGTSATSTFIDETVPELPWNLWLGVSYAIDTEPPKPVIEKVNAPAPIAVAPTERFIQGTVLEKGTQNPVPNALIRFDGRPITGMISDEAGRFRSSKLTPGTYTFNLTAQGYRDGQCTVTVTDTAPVAPGAAGALPPQPIAPGSAPPAKGDVLIPVTCELEALPKLGIISGSLTDGETNQIVSGARIKAIDRKNRQLELAGDASGAFRITNIPPGPIRLTIDAPGYFTTTAELDVKALEDLQARIVLNKRPAQPNVVVQGNEVKLKKQVHFETDSADIAPDSLALLEEIADVLKTHTEISAVEVQGHTDNTGTPPHNLRLSSERAQAVVDALVKLGVDGSRLTAKGYGQEKPLVPNATEAMRARNRRVQLIIQKK